MDSKRTRITIGASIAILIVLGVAAVYFLFFAGAEPVEVASAWPQTDSERAVAKPELPPIWPLTGLPAPDGQTPVDTRVVSVKIENSPSARPQSGIQSADVVYESITEGGITRFNCLFHSTDPGELVGPVRSARLSDVSIVPQYKALFVFSGANSQVNKRIRDAGLENLSEDAGVTNGYTRVTFKPAPHNLFMSLSKMREEGTRRGYDETQTILPLAFVRGASQDTPQVSKITVPFSPANTAVWTYDADKDAYLRVNNGKVHTDRSTGEQISSVNVVVLWAKTIAQSKRDVTGSTTYDIELLGTGRGTLFRNGQKIDMTWTGAKGSAPTFKAADGTQVRLSPGNTWFQVVPTNVNIAMQ